MRIFCIFRIRQPSRAVRQSPVVARQRRIRLHRIDPTDCRNIRFVDPPLDTRMIFGRLVHLVDRAEPSFDLCPQKEARSFPCTWPRRESISRDFTPPSDCLSSTAYPHNLFPLPHTRTYVRRVCFFVNEDRGVYIRMYLGLKPCERFASSSLTPSPVHDKSVG